jgi:MATE family multidrug resistance protein
MSPLREVWTIAWPTVLTMTSYTAMQFADKIMVAQVGPLQLTAQSNGGIWAFNAMAIAMGIMTVINTFVSQNLGAGRPERGAAYAWAGLWLSAIVWICIMIPWALVLPWLFASMPEHSADLQALETGYAQILLGGSVVLLASRGINQYFFGMHQPKVITVAAIIGNITNVAGNYILIYGSAGVTIHWRGDLVHLPGLTIPGMAEIPAMGVYGAALATVVGTAVELAIPACIFLGPKMNRTYHTRSQWRVRWKPIGELLKLGWPAAVQWGSEIICWSIFMSVLVGRFGETHMAAGWIALSYMHLSFMPAVGFAVAVTSLVGKYIGAGLPDVAERRAHLGLRVAVGYMTVCGLLFFLLRHQLVRVFVGHDVTPEETEAIVRIGGNLMICAAVFQTFDAFGIIYSGALRGAGDTIWPGVVTIIYSWLFIVLGGWLLVKYAPGLESIGPWIAASGYIILFGMTMWRRFEGGRWRAIRLLEPDKAPVEVEPAAMPIVAGSPAAVPEVDMDLSRTPVAASGGDPGPGVIS